MKTFQKRLGTVALTLAVLGVLAAIWAPGAWWQWAITAALFLIVGAALQGNADKPAKAPLADGGIVAERIHDGQVIRGTGDPDLDKAINGGHPAAPRSAPSPEKRGGCA